jgi:hypothetical protein
MRLLRLVSVVPVFALMSCWDFSALNATNTPQFSDGGEADMYFCDKSPLSIAEDCTDGIDNNDDCRTDCEDPQCQTTHLKCVDPNNQIIGYGNKIQAANNCVGSQTSTSINQHLSLTADCSNGCSCQANTAWRCNSTLRVFDDMAKCMGNMERGNTPLASGIAATPLNDCKVVPPTAAMGDYFKLDAVNSLCPLDTTKPGMKQASWGNSQKFCSTTPTPTTCQTMACMAAAGNCIAFNGNMASCPSPFAFKEVWYRSYTDNRVCTCSCAAGGGSCVINTNQAQLTTSATCGTGGGVQTSNVTQAAVCVPSGLGGGNTAAAMSFQARPICAASGVAPTDLATEMAAGRVTLNNPITLCCQQ